MKKVKCYLDRVEDAIAVFICGESQITIPEDLLPDGLKEGDHLVITFDKDEAGRDSTAREITDLQEKMQSGNDNRDG